ncbi:MAG: Fur family transcriptional regulator [Eubacteriales bacterium]|nr:Fur family transcriptional regulator [Eubacteriales bacterium]
MSRTDKLPNREELIEILRKHGLSVSKQRLAILDYLYKNKIHPSAEMIYMALREGAKKTTLSRATVYNNVRAFVDVGILREIRMGDEEERRYDIDDEEHCHLYCRACRKIINLYVPAEELNKVSEVLKNHAKDLEVENVELTISGLCKKCQEEYKSKAI